MMRRAAGLAVLSSLGVVLATIGQGGCGDESGDSPGSTVEPPAQAGTSGAADAAGPGGQAGQAPAQTGGTAGQMSAGGAAGGTALGGAGGGAAGPAPPGGKVPIFVAQGEIGRTMISCDDGKSWVGNHSWDVDGTAPYCGARQAMQCGLDGCSYTVAGQCRRYTCCSDAPDRSRGIAYGDGKFVATWGWGQPGALRASTNGIDWVTSHPGDSYGGVAFGGGRFVAASRAPIWSADGLKWTAGQAADFRSKTGQTLWSVRRFAYADYQGGGRFVAISDGDMLVSSDGGQTWWRPTTFPTGCGASIMAYGGIVSGKDVIVAVGQGASACRSTDGGKTWTLAPTGITEVLSAGVWTGQEFRFWGNLAGKDYMISSPDGTTWTRTLMATQTWIEPVARSASGTYVAVSSVWSGYASQQFLRSTDGLTWQRLPSTAFAGSHPIFHIVFGYAEPSTACPKP